MGDLLLSREELDEIENNPIFTLWLFGDIDESKLTEHERNIIFARQMYYDLILPDEQIYFVFDQMNCHDFDTFLNDSNLMFKASQFLGVRKDRIITKVALMKKRKENQMKLNLKEEI